MRIAPGSRTTAARAAVAAVTAAAAVTLAAPATAGAKIRVAVQELRVEGDSTPALMLQLQDGFVLGLVRMGVEVLDPVDTARRLEKSPELAGCDSSPCLKNIGRLLEAKFIVRVKVDVAGNSYKMLARLFSTEGAAPAALPISTRSRSCDVCTVAEAREHMLRLADALRPEVEEPALAPAPPHPPPPAPRPSLVAPLLAVIVGAAALAGGIVLYASLPACTGGPAATPTPCEEHRERGVLAGGLMGAGAVAAAVGTYVTIVRVRAPAVAPTTMVALTVSF